jgi:hypothetical protein
MIMDAVIHLDHSTYSGYGIIISRVTYLSKVGYNNKLKEYYFDIGYDSSEFSKFTLSYISQEEAEVEREKYLEKINNFLKK